MHQNPFFRVFDEVGSDPRLPERPKVFPNTRGLHLDPVERPWARWDGGTLGDSGVELWHVRSTGHAIDLVGASRWSFHMPLRGGITLTFGRDETEIREGTGALMGTRRRRTHVQSAQGGLFQGIVVLFDPARTGLIRAGADRDGAGLVSAQGHCALTGYLRFLSAELSDPASSVHAPAARAAAGTLLAELIAANASAVVDQDAAAAASVGSAHVRRAEEIMRARFADPLTVPAIAAAIGVGPRALQAAFARHRGMSPRAALTAMRLEAAHDGLRSARPEDTVTTVALACGFAHLGRFARAFALRFGESPSDTLARARRKSWPQH